MTHFKFKEVEFEAAKINNNSNNDKLTLKKYIELIDPDNKFYIDIGSSYEHNLAMDFIIDSDLTIFFECDLLKASYYDNWNLNNFNLITTKITPTNATDLIEGITDNITPKLIDIDIDGYDYFVLKALLNKFTPSLIVAEINEKIPPPIKFTVKYDPDYWWDSSHFYGMSLSKMCELAKEYGYELINLTYNNVFLVHKDKNPGLETYTAKEAYDRFYRYAGWERYFSHNEDMRPLLRYTPENGVNFLHDLFKKYEGKYELYI